VAAAPAVVARLPSLDCGPSDEPVTVARASREADNLRDAIQTTPSAQARISSMI